MRLQLFVPFLLAGGALASPVKRQLNGIIDDLGNAANDLTAILDMAEQEAGLSPTSSTSEKRQEDAVLATPAKRQLNGIIDDLGNAANYLTAILDMAEQEAGLSPTSSTSEKRQEDVVQEA